ncbi:hypothetical protein SDC9_142836 [bioreactor metagenome]|uniref:NAD-specific glutamate dehydrogenase n=1 Tax=bioreactor metagenome TaxID=1076179 RepID=A0A645E297_9ZZZZ
MQCGGTQSVTLQGTRQTRTAQLAVGEDEGLANVALLEHGANRVPLVVIRDLVEALLHRGRRLVGTSHLDGHGVLQIAAGQTLDLGRERGREQQRGAALGQIGEDTLQIGQKADIQHAVGLVQHHIFHLIEHHILGLDVVQQTTGRGHQHLDAFFQLDGLRLHIHAAKHHGAAQLGVLGIQGNLLRHLVGQLTRGQQHQGTHRMAGRRCRGVFMAHQALQQGQGERRRLACAGLGCAHDVLAGQYHRNGLRLNRSHGLIAHVGHCACQGLSQVKIGERACH